RCYGFVTTQKRTDARDDFARAEWLRNVIICTKFQSNDSISFFASSRQNQNRCAQKSIVASQLAANLESVESRKHQIQDDQVRWVASGFGQSKGSVGSVIDLKAFFLEVVFQKLDKISFVFNDQNLF